MIVTIELTFNLAAGEIEPEELESAAEDARAAGHAALAEVYDFIGEDGVIIHAEQ